VRLTYSTLKLRLPPDALHELAVVIGAVPGRSTGMALLRQEADTWMFTAIGMVGVRPPDDLGGMTTFIEEFAPPHVVAAVREAQPLSEHASYVVPSSRWRRYDKMRRFPSGLLVLGDAMCSFNPVYGQGMTVAAMEAEALHRCLTAGADGLTRRYFHAAEKIVGNAWQLAAGGDLALPEVEGPRPAAVRFANRYVSNVQAAPRPISLSLSSWRMWCRSRVNRPACSSQRSPPGWLRTACVPRDQRVWPAPLLNPPGL
jgi:2-polyprenyl-6-methoxyphenol hydroxylase-like FAD-dependent oxidoreductase